MLRTVHDKLQCAHSVVDTAVRYAFQALQTSYVLGGFPHVDSRCGCMSTLGNREIHTDPSAINLHACTLLLGYFCILRALKVHKRKSP
jgi:hypothetical protein